MNNELISVIVPVYNVEDYLPECINSILNQSYKELEIILINDGSTDGSLDICKFYAENDKRIVVVSQENKGLSGARNTGIDLAHGKYLSFIDSDDFVEPSMIQNLYNSIRKYDASIATCGRYIYCGKITEKRYGSARERVYNNISALDNILRGDSMDVAMWDKLFKSSLFENIRFPVGEVNEDTAIIYRILNRAGRMVHTGTYEYYYRQRSGSITNGGFSVENSIVAERHLEEMHQYIKTYFPSVEKSYNMHVAIVNFSKLIAVMKEENPAEEQRAEMSRRKVKFNKYFKYYIFNKNNSIKHRLIAMMLRCNLYDLYLKLKRKIIRIKSKRRI